MLVLSSVYILNQLSRTQLPHSSLELASLPETIEKLPCFHAEEIIVWCPLHWLGDRSTQFSRFAPRDGKVPT